MKVNTAACVRRLGLGAFMFFLIKGCVWLVIFAGLGAGAMGL